MIPPLIYVSMAEGIVGLIFRNTEGLREAEGLKKVLGWAIGILAYLILVLMALVLVLKGFN